MPSLGEDGWISDHQTVAERMFGHFFLSDYSQTALYSGNVASFAKVMSGFNSYDAKALCEKLKTTLERYYDRYMDDTYVEVTEGVDPEYVNDFNRFSLNIYVEWKEDGNTYTLHRALEVVNGKTANIIKLNNFG
jgi:hypothetical protein